MNRQVIDYPRRYGTRDDPMTAEESNARLRQEQDAAEDAMTGDLVEFNQPLSVELDGAAFIGPLGQYATSVAGRATEASATTILVNGLAAFGACVGRSRWVPVGAQNHHPACWFLVIGPTSTGKKGTGRDEAAYLFGGRGELGGERVRGYGERRMTGGNSGEGLEKALIARQQDDETQVLIEIAEFSTLVRRSKREGSTLSATMRNLFDGGPVERLVANGTTVQRVERTHAGVVADVTPEELMGMVDDIDARSGFLNRFVMVGVAGSHIDELPAPDHALAKEIGDELNDALTAARDGAHPMALESGALDVYKAWRRRLRGRTATGSIYESLVARAEAHVLRLALTYALTETATRIEPRHLAAALAVWDLHERTVLSLWAQAPAEGHPRRAWNYLREQGPQTASQLKRMVWPSNKRDEADKAIAGLQRSGWVRSHKSGRGTRLEAVDLRSSHERPIGALGSGATGSRTGHRGS
jgi:hypothetical protein